MATLTGANSVITLGVVGIFNVPVQLHGFDVDDVLATAAVKSVETRMGVDGRLSGGWVATEKVQTYTLQADSESNFLFDEWVQTQEAQREAYPAFGNIILPAVGTTIALIRGFLTSYPPMPDVKKILQPRRFEITWERVLPARL
jgi:hypothetical protein